MASLLGSSRNKTVFRSVFEWYGTLCIELCLALQDVCHPWDFCKLCPLKHWTPVAPASHNYNDNQEYCSPHSDTARITVFLLAENHLSWEKGLEGKADSRLSEGSLVGGDRWCFVFVFFSHSSNKTQIGLLVGENYEKVFIRIIGTH